MSHEINTKESIKIKVTDEATRKILENIIEQFGYLNKGKCFSSGEIRYVNLTVDGQSVTAEYDWKRNFGKEPVFKEDSDLMRLLNSSDITEFEMLLEYSAMVHGGVSFGSSFLWDLCNMSDKSVLAHLEYKVLEYYDYDTEFTACKLCDGELVTIEPNADIADITAVKEWFSYDFSLGVSSDDDLEEEVAKKVRHLVSEFKEKFNLDDGDFVFWEEAVFFNNSFIIEHEFLPELIQYIEIFARFAQENNLNLVLDGVFTPFDDTPEFAYMYFVSGENGVEIVSAKY